LRKKKNQLLFLKSYVYFSTKNKKRRPNLRSQEVVVTKTKRRPSKPKPEAIGEEAVIQCSFENHKHIQSRAHAIKKICA
jgi:hypothetical protein